jgi:hypothetical protein
MNTARRTGVETLISGRVPLPSFKAWLAANPGRFKPGSVNQILIMHDYDCRYPWGEPCTCVPGPEIRVAGENPGSN